MAAFLTFTRFTPALRAAGLWQFFRRARPLTVSAGGGVEPPAASVDSEAAPSTIAEWTHADVPLERAPYLGWLLALPAPETGKASTDPRRTLLQHIDQAIGTPSGCARLLRRAPNVVPRLINALRSEAYSRSEVAQHILRDPLLTAEVLRMARSALYAHHIERTPTVSNAIDLLGTTGLKQVVARVMMRPLFEAGAGTSNAIAAPRIWEESDRCAKLCVALARESQVDAVDAYLAGLLNHVAWGGILRAIETSPLRPSLAPTDERLAAALFHRRDLLLARLLPAWDITPALTGMARSIESGVSCELHRLANAAEDLVIRRRNETLAGGSEPPDAPEGCTAMVGAVYQRG